MKTPALMNSEASMVEVNTIYKCSRDHEHLQTQVVIEIKYHISKVLPKLLSPEYCQYIQYGCELIY